MNHVSTHSNAVATKFKTTQRRREAAEIPDV